MSELEGENFDPVVWVNRSLSSATAASAGGDAAAVGAVDDVVGGLQRQLRQEAEDAHVMLHSALQKALHAAPRSLRDVETVRRSAVQLRKSVEGAGASAQGIVEANPDDREAEQAVADIAAADAVVRRVERAGDLLAKAAEVQAIAARLEAIFVSGDLIAAANAVATMRANLEALREVSGTKELRTELETADRRLNAAAEPRLASALETRNDDAARAALSVFRKSGREDAFVLMYVAFRGNKMRETWRDIVDGEREDAVAELYQRIGKTLEAEAQWLLSALPSMRAQLLPPLVTEFLQTLDPPIEVELPHGFQNDAASTEAARKRLQANALHAASFSRRFATLLASEDTSSAADDAEPSSGDAEQAEADAKAKSAALADALVLTVDSAMVPASAYLDAFPALVRASAVQSVHAMDTRVSAEKSSLDDIASVVASAQSELCRIFDTAKQRCVEETLGVTVEAVRAGARAAATAFSSSIQELTRALPTETKTGWSGVQGALSLLMNLASLARLWTQYKEQLYTEAITSALPLIESASLAAENDNALKTALLGCQGDMEAAVLWKLARESAFRNQATRALQQSEFEQETHTGGDFESILDSSKSLVHQSMFSSIRSLLNSMREARDWGAHLESNDDGLGVEALDFSLGPMPYATETGEQLLTIPQQLEPFLPDDDPALVSPSGDADEVENVQATFARRWITSIARDTMDTYVDLIRALPKISDSGAAQLSVDIDYVSSVIGALGASLTPEFEAVRSLLESENAENVAQPFLDDSATSRVASRIVASRKAAKLIRNGA